MVGSMTECNEIGMALPVALQSLVAIHIETPRVY